MQRNITKTSREKTYLFSLISRSLQFSDPANDLIYSQPLLRLRLWWFLGRYSVTRCLHEYLVPRILRVCWGKVNTKDIGHAHANIIICGNKGICIPPNWDLWESLHSMWLLRLSLNDRLELSEIWCMQSRCMDHGPIFVLLSFVNWF